MAIENASFLDMLFSKNSIAGVWAVIGAVIALIGVFTNNAFENMRSKKEREHALIRDVYIGGIEYINFSSCKIMSIANAIGTENNLQKEDVASSEKFYKLFLIASPEVIEAFTKLSAKFANIMLRLSEVQLNVQKLSSEHESHKQGVQFAIQKMNQVNADRKEYNDKNKDIPELLELFDEHFEEAQRDFESNQELADKSIKQATEAKLILLRECIEKILETYPYSFEAIFKMRDDLDRKLSKADARRIKNCINLLEAEMRASFESYLERIKLQIIEMEEELS